MPMPERLGILGLISWLLAIAAEESNAKTPASKIIRFMMRSALAYMREKTRRVLSSNIACLSASDKAAEESI